MVICKECNREFDSFDSVRRHSIQKHGVNSEQTYIDYMLNGIEPQCKCGCGIRPTYLGVFAGFRDYKWGHGARISNNLLHTPETHQKGVETRKKMFENGELSIWNKGLTMEDDRVRDNIEKVMANPNRGANISKKLLGVPKSDEHKAKVQKAAKLRWSDPDERGKQSNRLISRLILNNHRNKKTRLEINFEDILISLGLVNDEDFKYQHQLSSAMFDFYLLKKNILIESDGDFHHCNPNTIHKIPKFPIQLKTVGNDIRKNLIAEDNNIKLLRFWEKDIKERPEWVIDRLTVELT